jgi:hypothetical protein
MSVAIGLRGDAMRMLLLVAASLFVIPVRLAASVREAFVRLAREFDLEYRWPSPHELVVSFEKK